MKHHEVTTKVAAEQTHKATCLNLDCFSFIPVPVCAKLDAKSTSTTIFVIRHIGIGGLRLCAGCIHCRVLQRGSLVALCNCIPFQANFYQPEQEPILSFIWQPLIQVTASRTNNRQVNFSNMSTVKPEATHTHRLVENGSW